MIELRRVLICRTDNIGDVVLTLPLAGFLKQRFPDAVVDFACRAYAAPVPRHCAHIDNVIAVDADLSADRIMTQGRYDTVIFAFPDRRLARAAKAAGIRNRVGTSHRVYHWLLCNRLAHFSRARSPLHEAQLNFALLRPLGIDVRPAKDELQHWYGLAAPAKDAVDALRREARYNIVLHPKSNRNGREWPLDHFLTLARELRQDAGVRLWVTGSAAEGALLGEQVPELFALPNVINLCGKFDLDGLMALIGQADGLVASGTGPLHIAAALGRPTLGLFPPLKPIDPDRWGALGPRACSMCRDQPCTQCTGVDTCRCMRAIAPADVRRVIVGWLGIADAHQAP